MTFFEDFVIGDRNDLGRYTFEAEAIKRFAKAYDPQSFHVDELAAKDSHFGALCASGWHTAAVWMRLMTEQRQAVIQRARAQDWPVPDYGPSPGFEKLRWLRPVYAGDTIVFSSEVVGLRPLKSRPQWGLVTYQNEGAREDGTPVFSLTSHLMVQRRNMDVHR